MVMPCQFERIENRWWKCTSCGYIHCRPSSRAPIRLCGKPGPSPKPRPAVVKRQKTKRRPEKVIPITPKPLELGDAVHEALSFVGITPERVTAWIGRPCRCSERQEKLNNLSRWAKGVITGKTEDAKGFLEELIK